MQAKRGNDVKGRDGQGFVGEGSVMVDICSLAWGRAA